MTREEWQQKIREIADRNGISFYRVSTTRIRLYMPEYNEFFPLILKEIEKIPHEFDYFSITIGDNTYHFLDSQDGTVWTDSDIDVNFNDILEDRSN